jgi:cell division inhibitor SepF
MGLLQRLRDVLGLDGEYEEYYVEYEGAESAQSLEKAESTAAAPPRPNNVVGMPGLLPGQTEMILMEPRSFDEMPAAVHALRERKSVILNLNLMDIDQAQRSADYVAGATFAIDGHQKQLGVNIFLFTPSFVQISQYQSIAPSQPKTSPSIEALRESLARKDNMTSNHPPRPQTETAPTAPRSSATTQPPIPPYVRPQRQTRIPFDPTAM